MVRNPVYWRPQKANLDRIIFKVLPDRNNTVIAQAKTGDIDLGIDFTEAQIQELIPTLSRWRTIHGFDALLVLTGSTASANL